MITLKTIIYLMLVSMTTYMAHNSLEKDYRGLIAKTKEPDYASERQSVQERDYKDLGRLGWSSLACKWLSWISLIIAMSTIWMV
jgi:hypothetical protein